MPPDRDLDRELRDLGPRVAYPPVPDLARSVRSRLEAEDGTAGSPSRSRPQLWWIAAAALVLIVAIPAFASILNNVGSSLSGDAATGGGVEVEGRPESGGQEAGDAAGPTRLTEDDEPMAVGEEERRPEEGEAQESIMDAGDGAGETGRPNGPVPDVVGMGLTAACEKLSSRGYVGYVIRTVEDAGAGSGRVVGQKPPAGNRGYVGGPVDLTVSEPYSEDDLRGMSRGRNRACPDATR